MESYDQLSEIESSKDHAKIQFKEKTTEIEFKQTQKGINLLIK